MNLLKEFSLNEKCSYLQNREQTMHYKLIQKCSPEKNQALIERGFRRFGLAFFRPICSQCNECKSIKIDAKNYIFSKSARRIMRKAKDIRTYIQQPSLTHMHLELFEKYHRYMHHKKGWEYHDTTAEHYYNSFVSGYEDFGYEVLYFYEDKLIGVDLIDILEDGISSIYFYYDPDFASYSLGKLSLYNQIKYAQSRNKSWIYLGYYVKDCPSLAYKAEYKPYLTLEGRPQESEPFKWF
jgi:arginine-tRNA-protein transferase